MTAHRIGRTDSLPGSACRPPPRLFEKDTHALISITLAIAFIPIPPMGKRRGGKTTPVHQACASQRAARRLAPVRSCNTGYRCGQTRGMRCRLVSTRSVR